MAENKMAQVAQMFGKKLGQRFTINKYGNKFDAIFLDTGLRIYGIDNPYVEIESFVLMDLLTGEAEIVED
jgi:hypothetical protein